MKLSRRATSLVLTVCCLLTVFPAQPTRAAAPAVASPVGLSIVEVKITGDEFLVLQNNTVTDISDLSSYWLQAYNNTNPLAAGVSNSTQQLPVAGLKAGQTLLLSATPVQTCGASVAGKLSLSLSDSGGFLQLTHASQTIDGTVQQTPGDMVSWSSAASGIIQNIPSSTKDPRAVFYRYLNGGSYAWQQADLNTTDSCQLNLVVAGGLTTPSAVTPLTLAATSPPATILGETVNSDNVVTATLPASDIGLNAPQLSELLPNPAGTGNDSTDEFIELYNPNGTPFDLTGFMLQVGTTTVHTYTFPAGTTLAANSFHAFYADETKLTMSNISGQASLSDPLGNLIGSTAAYAKAKDGNAWAIAKGNWYYTTQPTPGAANVIKQPPTKKAAASKTKKKAAVKSKAVKGAHTTKLASDTTTSSAFPEEDKTNQVHVWVLVLVGAAALLYGAYEYRRDITNRLYQLGSKLGLRRDVGQEVQGPGGDRTGE